MSAPKTIVILGGGVGGVVAARELRKRLPRQHRVVLVDREREHLFAPSLLWLMVGLREADSIKRPLKRLERKGIEVRLGEVEKIDPEARRVTVAGETLEADYLVVTLGAELAPETVPGLAGRGAQLLHAGRRRALRAALESTRKRAHRRADRGARLQVPGGALRGRAAHRCVPSQARSSRRGHGRRLRRRARPDGRRGSRDVGRGEAAARRPRASPITPSTR